MRPLFVYIKGAKSAMKMAKRSQQVLIYRKATLERSRGQARLTGNMVKEERTAESSAHDDDDECVLADQNEKEDPLKLARAEMDVVREENEKLKLTLSQIMKQYQAVQSHFRDNADHQEEVRQSTSTGSTHQEDENHHQTHELSILLSLGRDSSDQNKKDEKKTIYASKSKEDRNRYAERLALGLDCTSNFNPGSTPTEFTKNSSCENSTEESKEEDDPAGAWSPSKGLKTVRSANDDDIQHGPFKKARVSVRTICETPTMNDGCQWRKYGQKIAKGNPCPRSYYRCTLSSSCPVRKQVQRCVQNTSILTTTYEGTHDHPLPASATAMASTTSAAVSMLRSASSSSQPGLWPLSTATSTTSTSTNANLHGLNFTLTNNARPQLPFYFPNPTISTSQPHPTITLDLTAPHFNRLTSSGSAPRTYSSTCLDFSSSSPASFHSNTAPTSWANGYLSHGTLMPNTRSSHIGSALSLGRQPVQHQEVMYQPQRAQIAPDHQQFLTETISAATKVIASNPSFQSALATAITSLVGKVGVLSSSNSQQGSLTQFPPSLPGIYTSESSADKETK